MTKFEIKISHGSKLIKEIFCDEFGNSDIASTLCSIRALKKSNEEFLRDLVAKEKALNSGKSEVVDHESDDEEEDLMEDDEKEEKTPREKKRKTEE